MIPEKFKQRIKAIDSNGCWVWGGNITGRDARAFIWWDGRTRVAARVLYEIVHHIKLPKEMCVLHTCDNPKCVNPEHLYVGTQSDNARDRELRGRNNAFARSFIGSKNGAAKLTEEDVTQIRVSKESASSLAMKYRVSTSCINLCRAKKTWAHV